MTFVFLHSPSKMHWLRTNWVPATARESERLVLVTLEQVVSTLQPALWFPQMLMIFPVPEDGLEPTTAETFSQQLVTTDNTSAAPLIASPVVAIRGRSTVEPSHQRTTRNTASPDAVFLVHHQIYFSFCLSTFCACIQVLSWTFT